MTDTINALRAALQAALENIPQIEGRIHALNNRLSLERKRRDAMKQVVDLYGSESNGQ